MPAGGLNPEHFRKFRLGSKRGGRRFPVMWRFRVLDSAWKNALDCAKFGQIPTM